MSIRGRCTLLQVQSIYTAIVAECSKRQRNSTTIKELSDPTNSTSKYRLVGKTGDSTLATLKALHLIKTNRDVIVLIKKKNSVGAN